MTKPRLPLLAITTTIVLAFVREVAAQPAAPAAAPRDGEFSVQRFEPAPGPKNFLSVEGARHEGDFAWSAGLMFDYSREPFVVVSCVSETDCDAPNATSPTDIPVVSDMLMWNVLGSFNPISILQIGLRVPFAYVRGQEVNLETGQGGAETSTFGMGDPTLEGKVRFFGTPKDPFVLGAALDVSAPLGHATAENAYIGNSSPVTLGVRGIFDGNVGPASFGLNLRALIREDSTLASTTIGPEFRYGVGAGYKISPVFKVLAEGYGATRFSSKNGTNSLEIDGAVQVTPLTSGLYITAGGGAGIIQGVGVPLARGILGVTYAREVGDQDGDGIQDTDDKCPTLPEDEDQFEDDDGCPEDDNDRDSVPDATDKCPLKPETINGVDDKDGCPDELADRDKDGIGDGEDKCPDHAGKIRTKDYYGCPDNDQDGVADKGPAGTEASWDKCPDQPEDTDGFNDTDGCPDPDNDLDGILDESDECIDKPEVKNGFKDEDGCPDESPDTDKDGFSDAVDKCPKQPENFNGFEDDDGCPDKGVKLVDVTGDEIKILERVEFATGSDKIQGPKSFAVLDAVAGVLKARGEIFLVEVAGHTDNVGPADANKKLSQQRAEAVSKYLTEKGVTPNRLQARGYGPEKPVADNKTNPGRQKNRRVEFVILKSTKKDTPATPAPAPTPAPPP